MKKYSSLRACINFAVFEGVVSASLEENQKTPLLINTGSEPEEAHLEAYLNLLPTYDGLNLYKITNRVGHPSDISFISLSCEAYCCLKHSTIIH